MSYYGNQNFQGMQNGGQWMQSGGQGAMNGGQAVAPVAGVGGNGVQGGRVKKTRAARGEAKVKASSKRLAGKNVNQKAFRQLYRAMVKHCDYNGDKKPFPLKGDCTRFAESRGWRIDWVQAMTLAQNGEEKPAAWMFCISGQPDLPAPVPANQDVMYSDDFAGGYGGAQPVGMNHPPFAQAPVPTPWVRMDGGYVAQGEFGAMEPDFEGGYGNLPPVGDYHAGGEFAMGMDPGFNTEPPVTQEWSGVQQAPVGDVVSQGEGEEAAGKMWTESEFAEWCAEFDADVAAGEAAREEVGVVEDAAAAGEEVVAEEDAAAGGDGDLQPAEDDVAGGEAADGMDLGSEPEAEEESERRELREQGDLVWEGERGLLDFDVQPEEETYRELTRMGEEEYRALCGD